MYVEYPVKIEHTTVAMVWDPISLYIGPRWDIQVFIYLVWHKAISVGHLLITDHTLIEITSVVSLLIIGDVIISLLSLALSKSGIKISTPGLNEDWTHYSGLVG